MHIILNRGSSFVVEFPVLQRFAAHEVSRCTWSRQWAWTLTCIHLWEVSQIGWKILLCHFELDIILLKILHVAMQMVQNLRGVVRLHNILILHPWLVGSHIICALHLPAHGLLLGATGSTTECGLVIHWHLVLHLVLAESRMGPISNQLRLLFRNIVHMTNAIVMIVLHISIILPLGSLLRLLILSLEIIQKNHLVLKDLPL